MAQARKKRRPNRQRDSTVPGWVMFAFGLGLGLFIALLVYINAIGGVDFGTGLKGLFTRADPPPNVREVRREAAEPLPKPNKPKFDFYTILPEIESILPNSLTAAEHRQSGVSETVSYILQAASYASLTDAGRLRNRLAQAKLEAYIEKVTVENKGDFYRVRLGPFDRLDKLDEVNKQLVKMGIRTLRLKVKKPAGG